MDTKRMNEIFSDHAFAKSLFELETAAQVKAELKKKGLDVNEEDVLKLRETINKLIQNGSKAEELSLNELDDVAGGVSASDATKIFVDANKTIFNTLVSSLLRW